MTSFSPASPGRRQILTGLAGLSVTAPLAAVLADPRLARAAAEGLEEVTISTADGREVSGALALPAETPAPTILLIHEWWGLNDQIKAVAAEFAKQGYVALACDLYGGKVAQSRERARSLMQKVDGGQATATLVAWVDWLKAHEASTGKVGTVGWCFGGGWSLNAAIAAPVDATVVYYGRVNRGAEDLANLKGPVLGHFATRDQWINEAMVGKFESAMDEAGKPYESHWYTADHAFANPTSARYDEEDAKLAWSRTLAFFAQHLKG
ncbi:MAG: dienelactone hydrolase family protein [Rhodovibrionaceae bacterium]|nr:dienelactone hydrolase family protein [Rhodovibrionaceae bacterium]